MTKSFFYSISFHVGLIFLTALTLPFMTRQAIDLPPIVSVELIQISDKTNIPYAPKARKVIEKVKEEEKRVVSEQAPPSAKAKEKPDRIPLPNENKDGSMCAETKNPYFKECDMPSQEDTRITNPACNLRGTGWNRWEWLCMDPQERVLMPFDNMISNRIIVKDNHRPCIPKPISIEPSLPPPTMTPVQTEIVKTNGVPTEPVSVQWRSTAEIGRY